MSYQKHTWVTNEIIRGKNLNHIEDGIYNEEQRAIEAEESNSQAILDETTRATTQEGQLSNRITTNTQDIATLNASASTVGSVDYKIAQAMADAGGYKVVADHMAVVSPSSKYIYLEPDPTATGSDKFEEWIYYYNEDESDYVWAMIGETSLDLSDYVQTSDLATVATSGSYNDLSDKPTIPSAVTVDNALSNSSENPVQNKVLTSALNDKADSSSVPTKTSDLQNDSGFINYKAVSTVANQGLTETEKSNARSNIGAGASSFSGSYNDLTDKPTIPSALSDLSDDSTHRTVTDTEKSTWNSKTSNTGTVTSVATGAGLTGGTITSSGTIKAKLQSETASSLTAATRGSTSSREYPVGIDAEGNLSVNVPWSNNRDFKTGTSRSGASNNTLYFIYS